MLKFYDAKTSMIDPELELFFFANLKEIEDQTRGLLQEYSFEKACIVSFQNFLQLFDDEMTDEEVEEMNLWRCVHWFLRKNEDTFKGELKND